MRRLAFWPAIVIILALAAPATAQTSAGGSIRGTIHDEQGGVLPGVTVTATSPSASTPYVVVTDVQGYYRLTDLQPGSYMLSAELSGFTKYERIGLDVRAALNIEVNIELKIGQLSETIQVVGETPMLEVEKPVQAVNISGDLQRQLPLLPKKDWSSYLEVTPSVSSLDNGGGFSQVYMVRGSEMEGGVFQLDGTDVGSFRQSRADNIELSSEAIQDVQVKTGGLDASAPLGVGVVVNMVSKSGTNVIKGAVSAVFQSLSWNGNNAEAGGSPATIGLFQPDIAAGGPIIRDHVFFFGAYQYSRQSSGISRSAEQIAILKDVSPGFTPFNNENRFNFWFAKGTVQFSPNHQLIAYVENDLAPKDVNVAEYGSRFERDSYGGKAIGVRLSSVFGSSVTTKFAVAYNDKSLSRDLGIFIRNPGPAVQIFNATAVSGGNRTGTGLVAQLNNTTDWTTSPTSKYTIQGDVTWYKAGWAGKHEFQVGFFLQPNDRNRNETVYPNDGQNLVDAVLNDPNDPAAGYTTFHKRQYAVDSITTKSVKAQDYAFYVQDTWKPVSRLSLSLGVRADKIIEDDLIFDKTIENAWNVGPRLGATYMLTEDGRNVLRGSYSVVHDMPQAIMIATIGSTRLEQTDYYDNNLDGVFDSSVTIPPSTALNQSRQIDPKFHQPYFQEAVIGYGRQFPGQLSVDATFLRRNYKDRTALVDVNGIYDNGVFKGYKDETLNDIYLITNNTYNWFVYSGFEVSVSKRAKNLQILGGYTRAWQHTAGTWQPNDPASFIQPDAFANDKGLGSWRGNTTSSLSYTADTRTFSWRPHIIRVGANYNFPYGFSLATSLSLMSGPYSGPVYTTIAAADPQFGPAKVTLSNGRSVPNPLATTYRFAYDNRGDGQLELPMQGTWNLKLDRSFPIGARELTLSAEVFNVTNNGSDQRFVSGGNVLTNANYGLGQFRQLPRAFQVSGRFEF